MRFLAYSTWKIFFCSVNFLNFKFPSKKCILCSTHLGTRSCGCYVTNVIFLIIVIRFLRRLTAVLLLFLLCLPPLAESLQGRASRVCKAARVETGQAEERCWTVLNQINQYSFIHSFHSSSLQLFFPLFFWFLSLVLCVMCVCVCVRRVNQYCKDMTFTTNLSPVLIYFEGKTSTHQLLPNNLH